jgi:hypothetical protein
MNVIALCYVYSYNSIYWHIYFYFISFALIIFIFSHNSDSVTLISALCFSCTEGFFYRFNSLLFSCRSYDQLNTIQNVTTNSITSLTAATVVTLSRTYNELLGQIHTPNNYKYAQ